MDCFIFITHKKKCLKKLKLISNLFSIYKYKKQNVAKKNYVEIINFFLFFCCFIQLN